MLCNFNYITIYCRNQVLQVSERELMGQMGESFVDFVGQYGYDRVLSVLGRHMRDFLNGNTINLHIYYIFMETISERLLFHRF